MLTRRRLITTAGQAALAGIFLPLLSGCSDPVPETVLIDQTPLVDLLLSWSSVSYAGPVCAIKLGLQPGINPLALQQALSSVLAVKLASRTENFSVEQHLQQLTRTDFAQGRTLDVDGWQLSETECQAAALAASLRGFTEPVEVKLPPPVVVNFVEVEQWGPKSTLQGEPFNEQSDGHSGIWVRAAGIPPATILVFAGRPQYTQVFAEHLTSGLRGKFMNTTISKPGKYTIELYDRNRRQIQRIGEFEVIERTARLPFYH